MTSTASHMSGLDYTKGVAVYASCYAGFWLGLGMKGWARERELAD
jgi:hypothetical protein